MTIAVAVVWFVALRPVALGGPASYIVVHGYSMSGALAPGDLVVTRAQAAYSAGDAIVYRVPSGAGQDLLVVHRIISADPAGYRMQGDANSYQDPWRPHAANVVGRIVVTLPGLGAFLSSLANPFVLAAVWGVAALVLGLSFLPKAPGTKSDRLSNPKIRKRSQLGSAEAVVASAVLACGLMAGLVVLNTVLVVYPASSLGAVVFSAACAAAITTVGLFLLPESPMQAPGQRWSRWSPIRIQSGYPMLRTTTGWAMTILIGLVMVSAYVTITPAHAAGLNARSETITAQVHKSQAYAVPRLGPPVRQGPAPNSGPPSIAPNGVPARPTWPSARS